MESGEKVATKEGGLKWAGLEIFLDVKRSETIVDEIANMPCLQWGKASGREKILAMGDTGYAGEEIEDVK
jgi:hypothetical protein